MKTKNNTRDMILEAATRLFQRQGYNGTGVNQIIEESGTPKGSLYYHFPKGKEEIALEAIQLVKEHILEQTKLDLLSADNVIQAFEQHITNVAHFYDKEDCKEWLKIGHLATETAYTHESIRHSCEKAFTEWQKIYADTLMHHGYEEKKAQDLAITINVMLEGATTISLTQKNGNTLRVIADQVKVLLQEKKSGGKKNEHRKSDA